MPPCAANPTGRSLLCDVPRSRYDQRPLAHGMKVVNLFWLEPLPCAETENYVADLQRYPVIRQAL